MMTTQPGLGYFYYKEFGAQVVAHDNIAVTTAKGVHLAPTPRYYDKLTAKTRGEERLELLKAKRKETMLQKIEANPIEYSGRRRHDKKVVRQARTKILERNI